MVYQREFKRNMKSLIIWGLIIAALILMMLSIYPQIASDQKALQTLMDVYPEGIKKAFGMGQLDFGTLLGFYGVEIYLINTLAGSIYVALLASGILVKEENDKTIEFLLSKPITRTSIVGQKIAAVITNVLLLNIIITIFSLLGFQFASSEDYSGSTFAALMFATLLLHLTIAAISFLLSSIMRRSRNIISLSLGVVFVSYFLHIIAGISDQLSWLKYISFFKYVDAGSIVEHGSMESLYIWIMLLLSIACIGGAFVYYKRKDIAV